MKVDQLLSICPLLTLFASITRQVKISPRKHVFCA